MQANPKMRVKNQTKKSFDWGISVTTIDFMQPGELSRVHDGSAGSDCGCGSGGGGGGGGGSEISNVLKASAKRSESTPKQQ
jgi:hypothetical protein